jgi:hypothetical protein
MRRFYLACFAEGRRCAPALPLRENGENEFNFAQALTLLDEDDLQRLLRETEREIAPHWSQVEAVAAALIDREFLSASEIYRIIVKAR